MNYKNYDCFIVGAGFSGAVIARKLAEELDKKVLIVEKREHIAGNTYDEKNDEILVQKYGPHIFHTSDEDVYQFITKYETWKDFKLKCEVVMDNKNSPSPFNLKTIDIFYDEKRAKIIKENLKKEYGNLDKTTIVEMLKSKNEVIKEYAMMLFEKDYSLYTAKQWGISPREIDVSVLKRVPVRLDYEDMYFDDKYECFPEHGYTEFFKKLLDHKNITVITSKNAFDIMKIDNDSAYIGHEKITIPIVFTGAIDDLFKYKYGTLPYRSLKFTYVKKDIASFQNAPVTAYPQAKDFTRITEYTKLPMQNVGKKTIIAYEYPLQFDEKGEIEPYYPIPNEINVKMYEKYRQEALKISNLFLCGRLAEYKYYNMDQVIKQAILKYDLIRDYLER